MCYACAWDLSSGIYASLYGSPVSRRVHVRFRLSIDGVGLALPHFATEYCRVDSERETLDTPGRTLAEFINYGTDTVARPLTSLAKQLAHRLLGSPEMTAELAMRRSVLSIPSVLGAARDPPQSEGSPGQAGQRGSFFDWLPASVWPLFEILRGRQPAGNEQVGPCCLSLASVHG